MEKTKIYTFTRDPIMIRAKTTEEAWAELEKRITEGVVKISASNELDKWAERHIITVEPEADEEKKDDGPIPF